RTTRRGTLPARSSPRGGDRARLRASFRCVSAYRAIVRTKSSSRWIARMEETDPDAAVVPSTPARTDPGHWAEHTRSYTGPGASRRGHDDRAVAIRWRGRLVREPVRAAEPAALHP